MYSNFADSEVINRGRKKVFQAVEKLELLLPNNKSDGFLEEGDAVYVIQKVKKGNEIIYRFRVIKFADTIKQQKVYSAEKKYFKPHFEKTSAVIGDKKNNGFIIPTITGIGIGVLGYFIAERFQKNNERSNEINEHSDAIKEKQEQLEKIMDEMLDDEMKKKLDRLQELMDKLSKEELFQKLEEIKQDQDLQQKDFERLKALMDQLEKDMRMEDLANKIRDLAKLQDKLQ